MNTAPHFSSAKDDWETPIEIVDELAKQFGPFDLDVACSETNKKAQNGIIKDSLDIAWNELGKRAWMNPPYGREIGKWIEKAYKETLTSQDFTITCLLPSRTDTQWWHRYVMKATRILFVEGRIKFSGHDNSAPFPSAIVYFGGTLGEPIFKTVKFDV